MQELQDKIREKEIEVKKTQQKENTAGAKNITRITEFSDK